MVTELNNKLEALYRHHWPDLLRSFTKYDTIEGYLSNPLLLNAFPEYENAKTKIMIVGQQTKGWGCWLPQYQEDDIIARLMKAYSDFRLGEKYKQTPFWKLSYEVYQRLNPDSGSLGYIWNDLIKMDQSEREPDIEIEKIICESFPVIIEEINILKPDCVLFFTGPYYDSKIEIIFKNYKEIPINGFVENELVKIQHSHLPVLSFRTYHPKYLKLKRQDIIPRLISHIILERDNLQL